MSKISELSDGGSLISSDYLIAVRSGGNVKVRMDQINVDQVDLGDNEFIRLGNSQDLTMVHTSTESIINQAGIGDLLIQRAGATKLTINASGIDVTGSVTTTGNAGIGTSSPKTILNASTSTGAILTLESSDTTLTTNDVIGGVDFYANDSSTNGTGAKVNIRALATSTAGTATALTFGTSDSASATATERMRIDASGNVGIGTNDVTDRLTINADAGDGITFDGISASAAAEQDVSEIKFINRRSSGTTIKANIKHITSGTANGSALTFGTTTGAGATERMRINSSGNVGIGTGSPSALLGLNSAAPDFTMLQSDAVKFRMGVSGGINGGVTGSASGDYFARTAGGKMLFSTDDGVTAHAVLDSSGNVGIGTTSPRSVLDLDGGSETQLRLQTTNTGSTTGDGLLVSLDSSTNAQAYVWNYENAAMIFGTNATEAMRIDASGNVGIGVVPLPHYYKSLEIGNTGSHITGRTAADTHFMSGVYWSGGGTQTYAVSSVPVGSYNITNGVHIWNNAPASTAGTVATMTEAMRIDTSGNLLVSKSANNITDTGAVIRSTGETFITRSGNPLSLNRLSSDGSVLEIRKDSAAVGSIGVATEAAGTGIYIGKGDTCLSFQTRNDNAIAPFSADTGTVRDNAIDLGVSVARFDNIYATNGTIQTSDRNDKQDIETLSDAEQRVAVACKGLLRKWRWKDAVEAKGDDARIHFGIIAQDLQAAFEAEGLDAGRYAMFISSTWTDEETGEERSRMGVRYSELLAFIIAAI